MPYFISEDGSTCGYYEEGQRETYHLTNFDMFKKMNVDELAAFLDSIEQDPPSYTCIYPDTIVKDWAEWLRRQPAKE